MLNKDEIIDLASKPLSLQSFLQVLDLYAACALITALLQFSYAVLVGTFPFNAFLAGFFCCIGVFVLTGNLNDLQL